MEVFCFCLLHGRCSGSGRVRLFRYRCFHNRGSYFLRLCFLDPFPDSGNGFASENRKAGTACKGIVPQADSTGAVIHAVYRIGTVFFGKLHTQGDEVSGFQLLNDLIIGSIWLCKDYAVTLRPQLFSQSLPAKLMTCDCCFSQTRDFPCQHMGIQGSSGNLGVLSIEQEMIVNPYTN